MKLAKFLKTTLVRTKRVLNSSPVNESKRSAYLYNKTKEQKSKVRYDKGAELYKKVGTIRSRINDKAKTMESAQRAKARLTRIQEHRQGLLDKRDVQLRKRLTKHENLRFKKDRFNDKVKQELTAFAATQKPVDFGSKKQYDKWQAARKAKKGIK